MEPRAEQVDENRGAMDAESEEERKERYRQRLDSKMREWTAQIERLRGRAKIAEADLKIKYNREIENLGKKKEVVERRLQELKDSGDEAWEALKTGTGEALFDLRNALKQARSRLRKGR